MAGLLSADLDYILNETRELWSFLRRTRLFLTGGTGFVGTWLVESFVHANRQLGLNAQLFLLSRNPEAFRTKSPQAAADPAIVFVPGSLSDCEIPTGTFPYVIHAATDQLSNPTPEEPAGTFDRELL